jgi:hypothetical protein
MLFPEDLVLENERVLLRPLVHEDLKFLIAFAEQEPAIWTNSAVSVNGEAPSFFPFSKRIGLILSK